MTFPFTIGAAVSGLVPVGRLANGEVTHIEDTSDGKKRVSVHFHEGTDMTYVVTNRGHCDYLSLGHNAGT